MKYHLWTFTGDKWEQTTSEPLPDHQAERRLIEIRRQVADPFHARALAEHLEPTGPTSFQPKTPTPNTKNQ